MDNFTEKLIQAVRERPFLYDFGHNDYKNNFKKSLAWKDICNEIGGESGEAVKEKWKNLKDTYKKHKKSLQACSGKAARKLKNWVWARQMVFLDASMRMRTKESARLNSNTEKNTQSSLSMQSNTQPSDSNAMQPTSPQSSLTEDSTQQQDIGNSRKRRNKDDSDKIIDYLENKNHEQTTDKLDKIDYLFLNYADTFKRLTPRRQAILKLELAKLFTEAELANMDEVDIQSAGNLHTCYQQQSMLSDIKME